SRAQPARKLSLLKLLAGATSATLSPGTSAGARMSLEPGLAKEFPSADDLGGSAQEDAVAGPADHLSASRSVDVDRRVGAARSDRGHRRSARTDPRGLRVADAALIESALDIVLALHPYKPHVDPVLEVVMARDLRAFRLPRRRKIFHEDHEVRISH